MPLLVKAAILSGIASFLSALILLIIGFRRSLRFEPPLGEHQLDAMQYRDAMAYMVAHSRHLSWWESLASIAPAPFIWLRVAEAAAWIFLFTFASMLVVIRWSNASYHRSDLIAGHSWIRLDKIEARLLQVFPAMIMHGSFTPHTCKECVAIRTYLETRSWTEVADEFTERFAGSLPLLSREAYHTYLPAWLRAAARNPHGETGQCLLYNLPDEPPVELFNKDQAAAVLSVARHVAMASSSFAEYDPKDPNVEQLAKIESAWSARAT